MQKNHKSLQARGIALAIISTSLISLVNANTNPAKPPADVASKYQSNIDWSVSDNFNTLDRNKWTYRTSFNPDVVRGGVGSSYTYIVKQGNTSFLSVRGSGTAKRGGGISSLNKSHYGFYIAKFRLIGFNNIPDTVWHPAIWGAAGNAVSSGPDRRVLSPFPSNWVEIDFMEWKNGTRGWDCHMIPRVSGKTESNSKWPYFFTNYETKIHSNWTTIGLEYRKDSYMQAWEFKNGRWSKRGPKIWYSGFENTRGKLFYKCRSPQYWIISNPWFIPAEPWARYKGDSWMHVDYFYHYKWK